MNATLKISAIAGITFGLLAATMSAPSFAGDFAQNHPRRAEVLRRDGRLNNRINRDYGKLHGHYGQLKREDAAIHRQERRDQLNDGGHITKGEQRQLNREENSLNRQIRRDRR